MANEAVVEGDLDGGHDGFAPAYGVVSQSSVFIEGKLAHVLGDSWNTHSKDGSSHTSKIGKVGGASVETGSKTVFIVGKAAIRTGDTLECGGVIIGSAGSVIIG